MAAFFSIHSQLHITAAVFHNSQRWPCSHQQMCLLLAPGPEQMLRTWGPPVPRTCEKWFLCQQRLLQPVIHSSTVSDSSRCRVRAPASLQIYEGLGGKR